MSLVRAGRIITRVVTDIELLIYQKSSTFYFSTPGGYRYACCYMILFGASLVSAAYIITCLVTRVVILYCLTRRWCVPRVFLRVLLRALLYYFV